MQPPSRGCVLKHIGWLVFVKLFLQPPSRGCVLKHCEIFSKMESTMQPPSRGCVWKLLPIVKLAKLKNGSRLRAAVC